MVLISPLSCSRKSTLPPGGSNESILLEVAVAHAVGDPFAVGGDSRPAQNLELKQVINGRDVAGRFACKRHGSDEPKRKGEKQGRTFEQSDHVEAPVSLQIPLQGITVHGANNSGPIDLGTIVPLDVVKFKTRACRLGARPSRPPHYLPLPPLAPPTPHPQREHQIVVLPLANVYLASDDSAYVVGADFLIDGGATAISAVGA